MAERAAAVRTSIGRQLGFKLHFDVVSKERLIQASILSANGDVAMMERLFDEITDTERIQSLTKVIVHLDRSQFGWNDVYLATTTPGQNYAGTFAGSDGANFFFRDDENRILVGNLKDLKRPQESERESASLLRDFATHVALGGPLRLSSWPTLAANVPTRRDRMRGSATISDPHSAYLAFTCETLQCLRMDLQQCRGFARIEEPLEMRERLADWCCLVHRSRS